MAQKISQMTEQTTASMTEAGTSDFLGGYTATGGNANRKFSLSGLANYFLNKFKMTLGGSSQTVKSAIDALNSKNVLYNTGIEGSDAATFLKNYLTHVTLPSDLTPVIFGGSWANVGYVTGIIRKVTASAFNGIMKVSLTTAGTSKEYSFWSWNGTDVYADQIPTRAEVDALNSKVGTFRLQSFSIVGGSTKTFTVPINGRYIVITTAYIDALKGIYILHSISNGMASISLVGGNPTNLTTYGGQNQFSITNNATVSTEVYILTMQGDAITV